MPAPAGSRIELMFDEDPAILTDEELTERLREIQALRTRLDAVEVATVAEWDRRRVWAADGSRSAAARLARETGVASATARERVRVAGRLRSASQVAAALAAGRLGWSKVRALLGVVNDRTAAAFARDEALLVEQAERLSTEQLGILLRHWLHLVDEDVANATADAMRARAFLDLAESFGGEGFLKGRLDPESKAIVKGELDAIAEELYRAERAAAKAGGDAAASGAHVVPARPLVVVNVDVERHDGLDVLRGRLADGTPLAEGEVRRLCCDAGIMGAVTSGGSVPIDLGRTTRTPSEAQRRFLASIWPTCAFPGCDRPFSWTEVHHIRWWDEHDGPTDLDNLLPQCSYHHQCHRRLFTIERGGDGSIRFSRPDGSLIGTANPTLPDLLAPLRQAA
jgi:hypothetical protein